MAAKLTIQDIARLAGVSKATVSRVLNQRTNVDPATRERVLRIMNEQGFVPSVAAAGLAGGRSRIIGVLVPSLRWPLIPEIMRGIADFVEDSSYEILLYSVNYEKDHSDIIDRILATKLATGLLAVLPGQSSPHLTELHDHGFPVVVIDDQELPTGLPWIGTDNRLGAYTAVRHLIDLGHRHIAYIQGQAQFLCTQQRYEGYCQALSEAGLTPDPELIRQGDFRYSSSGNACANELFALTERPTAIFAGNDQIAYGVLMAAEQHSLRVPGDISVVGYDDMPLSPHMRPALTTIRQPFYEMGQEAIKLLLSLVELQHSTVDSGQVASPQVSSTPGNGASAIHGSECIQLPIRLIMRESCGTLLQQPVSQ
jgi:LacI family transcriptional regulator